MSSSTSPPPERFTARITGRHDEGGGLVTVELLPAPKAAASYTTPGQYVQVHVDDVRGYFALASEEGAGTWQLLVRENPGAASALLRAAVGSPVQVTAAMGRGFPLEEARDRRLAIAVTAGALGPALPAVARRIRDGLADRTVLFVGTHSPAGLAKVSTLEALRARGVKVHTVMSEAAGEHLSGFVQDHLHLASPEVVWVVGIPAMVDAVKAWGRERGVDVRTN